MKMGDNTLNAIYRYSIGQIGHLYDENEVRSMVKIALNHYFNFDGKYLALHPDIRFSESELLKMVFLMKDLKKGRPIQFILGETEFCGLRLKVDENVLIPRQETEELIRLISGENTNRQRLKVIDIGTGSGCIALSLKSHFPDFRIEAVDASAGAINLAVKNAELNNLNIEFIEDDILDYKNEKYGNDYDIIVSNPPYVLESEMDSLHENVIKHEPHEALFVPDSDGLIFYNAIADFARSHLIEKGKLYFEINEKLGSEVAELLSDKGFKKVAVHKDLNGKDRIVSGEIPDS